MPNSLALQCQRKKTGFGRFFYVCLKGMTNMNGTRRANVQLPKEP